MSEQLHVIAVISNSKRFESRYRLYRQFERYMNTFSNVVLHTVELAFGDRPFEITSSYEPLHIQLRTTHELWHKENMINIAISRLPCDWKYVAWIDADIQFANPEWTYETIRALEHYPVVQMFSEVVDLSPINTIVPTSDQQKLRAYGFMYNYHQRQLVNPPPEKSTKTGLCWAYTREAVEKIGGMIDFAILGSGDWFMAQGLVGQMEESIDRYTGQELPEYKELIMNWQDNAVKKLNKNIGYVDGLILHYWHGSKKDRGYTSRNQYLIRNKYNPHLDLRTNSQNLLELTDRNPKLREDLRHYFSTRNEDCIAL